MAQQLPSPRTLEEAVRVVIEKNMQLGYNPGWFRIATQAGNAPGLVQICTKLFSSPEALESMLRAVAQYPEFLTLEDLVSGSEFGRSWGFDSESAELAEQTIKLLNSQAGCQRWRP